MTATVRSIGLPTSGTPTTTFDITKPAGLANEDVLYAVVFRDTNTAPTSVPSGFTTVATIADGTNALWMRVYRKVITDAAGEPSTYTYTWGSASSVTGMMAAVVGADNSTPEDGVTPTQASGASGYTVPTIDPATNNALVLVFAGVHDNLPIISGATSSGATWTREGNEESSGGSDCGVVICSAQVASGATGTITLTAAADPYGGIAVAIRPGPVDTTTARFALSDPGAVGAGTVTLRVRAQTSTGTGSLVTALYSSGSLVQSFTDSTTASWQTFEHTVTNAISDHATMEARLTGHGPVGTQSRVSWLEVELPSPPPPVEVAGTLAATATITTDAVEGPVAALAVTASITASLSILGVRGFVERALHASASPADIIAMGDSVAEGAGMSYEYQRWQGVLRAILRRFYVYSGVLEGTPGYQPGYYQFSYFPNQPVLAGATAITLEDVGLGARAVSLVNTGDSVTFTQTGTQVEVHYFGNNFFTSGISIVVDGGAPVNLNAYNPAGEVAWVWRSGTLSNTSHTVAVSYWAVNGEGLHTRVMGCRIFDGDLDKGVHVWDGGHSGARADYFNPLDIFKAEVPTTADLVIIGLGFNDAQSNTAAQFATNMTTLIGKVREFAPFVPVLLLGYNKATSAAEAGYVDGSWAAYMTALQGITDTNTEFIGLVGTYPDADNDPYHRYTTDGVHPTIVGHERIGGLIAARLTGGITAWVDATATITALAGLTYTGAATVATTATITTAGTVTKPVDATLAVTATLTAAATRTAMVDASLAATATISAAANETLLVGATVATTATLTAAATRTAVVGSSLAVTATLTTTATAGKTADATLACTATLTAAATRTAVVGAALAATATLTAGAVQTLTAGATVATTATLTTAATQTVVVGASLAGTATITVVGDTSGAKTIDAALPVTATLTAVATHTVVVGGALACTATLTAAATRTATVAASLPVTATLTSGMVLTNAAVASLAATATLTAAGTRTAVVGASLAVTATLSAAGTRTAGVVATLPVTATLTAGMALTAAAGASLPVTATLTSTAEAGTMTANLPVTATLTAVVAWTATSGASLPVTATITSAALRTAAVDATLPVTATITANAVETLRVGASLPVTATIGADLTRKQPVTASLPVTATVTVVGLVGLVAVLNCTATITTAGLRTAMVDASLPVTATLTAVVLHKAMVDAALAVNAALTANAYLIARGGASLNVTATVVAVAIAFSVFPEVPGRADVTITPTPDVATVHGTPSTVNVRPPSTTTGTL